jgi:hypothetical protein
MRKRALMGCTEESGGNISANSMAVIPRDQISAYFVDNKSE